MRNQLTRLLVIVSIVLCPGLARAKVIQVEPGPGTPIQDAIDAASPGDTVRLGDGGAPIGVYNEAIVIDKRLRLVGPVARNVWLEAGCGASIAMDIRADRVTVARIGQIRGGNFFTINIEDRDRVTLRNVIALEGCGTAEYGINVFNSTRVTLDHAAAHGAVPGNPPPGTTYADAGIYIGGIPADGRARLLRNFSIGNVRGLIVEDSTDAPGGAIGVSVRRGGFNGNGTGILLHNSDGVRLSHVGVLGPSGPSVGIELDAGSDDNRVLFAAVGGNLTDVIDNGSSNCWKGTSFTTGSIPTGGCP